MEKENKEISEQAKPLITKEMYNNFEVVQLDLSKNEVEAVDVQAVPRPRGRPPKEDANYKQDDYKDQKKAYAKQYYTKNKETMLNQMKEKVECERCQSLVSRTNLVPHQKTKKCKKAWNGYLDEAMAYVDELIEHGANDKEDNIEKT